MKFTDHIARYIREKGFDLDHLTIVLPSERARKYIAASLFREFGKPVFAPEMITIDRWVRSLSGKPVIDKTRALIRLYNIQLQDPAGSKDTSFDEFLSWGNILLSDYDELDRYMLSTRQVFKNLADVKELENWEVDNWSFGKPELTEGQKRFMEFWDKLPDYYIKLNEELDKEGVCYMGKAYRHVAENIGCVFAADKERHFVFAGFNALSPAEMSIMKQLSRMGRGHILLDADRYYLENPAHEAGRFLRRLIAELEIREPERVLDVLRTKALKVNVIECPQVTGQVKAAATILQGLDQKEIAETVVLLADEELIAPLLKNLPTSIGKANITLGLPLRNSALRTWVDLVFNLQENKQRFQTQAIYIQDLRKFWNHPFIVAITDQQEQRMITQLELKLIEKNAIFQYTDAIKTGDHTGKILDLLTSDWRADWNFAMSSIREMNGILFALLGRTNAFEKAVIEAFDASLLDLENIAQQGLPEMSLKSFKHLFQQHWNNRSIAYHGNPLDGLQIMGLLETRLLDFKNILVIGMNEGKMPPTNPIQTMIPMDLRAYFGLPVPRDKQGLFAHHFYRLLHGAENMWITYTSAQENIGSNEASRYLMQLELELERINEKVRIERSFYTIPNTGPGPELSYQIHKTPEIVDRLGEFVERSVSASALKKYMNCSLDFYYRHVLDFSEESEVEEEVENNTFGTFIHNVLERLYTPFVRHDKEGNLKIPAPRNITSMDIDHMLKHYEDEITKEFLAHFNGDRSAFSTGKNLLSYKMAVELTGRILSREKDFLMKQSGPVFIEFLEVELRSEIPLEIHGTERKVQLKGFVDRIDSVDGKIRIIDYKSGKVAEDDVKLKKLNADLSNLVPIMTGPKHVLQLLMYSYLYKKRFGQIPDEVAVYSLVNLTDEMFPLTGELSMNEAVDLFEELMRQIMEEMFDPEIPFIHQPGKYMSFCEYCE